MKDKYYTPTSKEVREGFRFEKQNLKGEWVKEELEYVEDIYEYCTNVEQLRVKYLDVEDIEELGFELKITDIGEDTSEYPDIYLNGGAIGTFF